MQNNSIQINLIRYDKFIKSKKYLLFTLNKQLCIIQFEFISLCDWSTTINYNKSERDRKRERKKTEDNSLLS